MRLIGYSVRLAFPCRADTKQLRDALAHANVGPSPTIVEAFEAIARRRSRFSPAFNAVFNEAYSALSTGQDGQELRALWSVILELAPAAATANRSATRESFQLFVQEDDVGRVELFLLAKEVTSDRPSGIAFNELREPINEYTHLVKVPNRQDSFVINLLLLDAIDDRVQGFHKSPVLRAVSDGVLLFGQSSANLWELVTTRPHEGRLRALVRRDVEDAFGRLVDASTRISPSVLYDGWSETTAFAASSLAIPDETIDDRLRAVRCLQRNQVGPQLQLVNGVRVAGAFLGLHELLPEVHCAGADEAILTRGGPSFTVTRSALATSIELFRNDLGGFSWDAKQQDEDGPCVLSALRDGQVVAHRRVEFVSRGLRYDYALPTIPDLWVVEDSVADVMPAEQPLDSPREPQHQQFAPSKLVRSNESDQSDLGSHAVDHSPHIDRLVEALSAISVMRKGIAESEIVDLTRLFIKDASGPAVWGILRGWVEAGYLDCLTKRHWSGRVYFARRPHMVLIPDGEHGTVRAVLHGLSPFRLRASSRLAFEQSGAVALPSLSLSRFVPAPPSWRFDSVAHATALSTELGLALLASPNKPEELLPNVVADVVVGDGSLPPGYESKLVWNWSENCFRRSSEGGAPSPVRIECFARIDGPDQYLITHGSCRRHTLSRNWALLYGFHCSRKRAFHAAESRVLRRAGSDGPHVPLPVARTLALRSGIVGGPTESDARGQYYAYAAESDRQLRWLAAFLNGEHLDANIVKRLRWLNAATAMRSADLVELPADLRGRLRELESSPDAMTIAGRRVPRRLVAHIRHAVSLIKK